MRLRQRRPQAGIGHRVGEQVAVARGQHRNDVLLRKDRHILAEHAVEHISVVGAVRPELIAVFFAVLMHGVGFDGGFHPGGAQKALFLSVGTRPFALLQIELAQLGDVLQINVHAPAAFFGSVTTGINRWGMPL